MKKTFSILALLLIPIMLASCAKTTSSLEGGGSSSSGILSENASTSPPGSFEDATGSEKTPADSYSAETETTPTESSPSASADPSTSENPSPSSATEPTVSEESPSPTIPSEQSAPIAGVLYEDRANFSNTFLPVRSGRWFGGQLSYGIDGSHEAIHVSLNGKTIEMRYTDTRFYTDEDGKRHALSHSYSAGDRFMLTTSSGASLDTEGRIVSLLITNFDLPDNFDETTIRQTAYDIAKQLCDFDLDSMQSALTTTVQSVTGHETVNGFVTEDADRYTVSFFVEVGGLKSGKYIDISFAPHGIPVPLMQVDIGYADTEEYAAEYTEDFQKRDIFDSILIGLPDLLEEDCAVSSVYFDENTLLFAVIHEKPCFYVSAVITLEDGMQYLTNLCYFMENP